MSPALIGGLVGILDLVRKAQLVLFPVIGLLVGAMLAKNSGVS